MTKKIFFFSQIAFLFLLFSSSFTQANQAPEDPKAKLMSNLKADLKKGKKPSKDQMQELVAKQGKAFLCGFACSKEATLLGLVDCNNEEQNTPFSHGFCSSCMKVVQDPKTKAEVALTVFACNTKKTKEKSKQNTAG
ncbi:MAG: hypothetical protein ACK5O7_04620 [Holosporales bacterium]